MAAAARQVPPNSSCCQTGTVPWPTSRANFQSQLPEPTSNVPQMHEHQAYPHTHQPTCQQASARVLRTPPGSVRAPLAIASSPRLQGGTRCCWPMGPGGISDL
eukprot:CAMPEP_0202891422 /NCGR_PEP_ID=MMETSP1392-20130828/1488_1 /ASSEMBLY_ACC=CAM_ASM_000868 /TAXON_ID=225041 /ORGANISM="Chlamydomonas chlamydogama, Strain SAG 11-48b" /LENGTH=102 /DNA_ID=CAMNT_0049575167 /DNA_START=304 /DNA_END=612 /DNA_ORIENTATION=-